MVNITFSFDLDAPEEPPCPCGSGLAIGRCCGVQGGTALKREQITMIDRDGGFTRDALTPQLVAAIDNIALLPDLFPARFDYTARRVLLTKMSPRWYRESSFLEPNRIKGHCAMSASLEWLDRVAPAPRWSSSALIFHTAFCGSTLMTRAVEAVYDCLSLREPEAIGSLLQHCHGKDSLDPASDEAIRRVYATTFGLLSRGYHEGQGVLIKASDNASGLMPVLASWQAGMPLLFMYVPLAEFLVGCLRTESRREWIAARYRAMRERAQLLLGLNEDPVIADDAFGEMAALYWSYNVALFYEALQHARAPVRSLDFNRLLADPNAVLEAAARLFSLSPLPAVDVEQQLERVFGTHAKIAGQRYSTRMRDGQIEHTLGENRAQLEAAETLARSLLAEKYPERGLPASL